MGLVVRLVVVGTVAVEGHVVDRVVDVDQEAAGGDAGHQGPAVGARGADGARSQGRNEVTAGAHPYEGSIAKGVVPNPALRLV